MARILLRKLPEDGRIYALDPKTGETLTRLLPAVWFNNLDATHPNWQSSAYEHPEGISFPSYAQATGALRLAGHVPVRD